MTVKSHKIELTIGFTQRDKQQKKEVTHKDVIFGKRIDGKRLFAIDSDPQSSIQTQFSDLLMRASITKFGSLKMPVALSVLLALDSIDREDLKEAYTLFSAQSLKELRNEGENSEESDESETEETEENDSIQVVADNTIKLMLGYDRNGLVYDLVEFGRRQTGMDEVEADVKGYKGIKRLCFLAGKQISKLSSSQNASVLTGPIGIDVFEALDIVDIYAIQGGAEVWRNSFRTTGSRLQKVGNGKDSVSAGS